MSKAHPREREQAHSDPSTHTSAHVDRPRHGSRSVPTQQRNQRNESWKRTALSCTQSCGNANTKPHESCTHPIAIRCNTTNEILIRTFRKGHNSLHQRLFFHALLLEDGRQTLVTRLDVVGNSGWVNGAHLVCSNIGSCVLLDDVAFVVLCVCSCVCVYVYVCVHVFADSRVLVLLHVATIVLLLLSSLLLLMMMMVVVVLAFARVFCRFGGVVGVAWWSRSFFLSEKLWQGSYRYDVD